MFTFAHNRKNRQAGRTNGANKLLWLMSLKMSNIEHFCACGALLYGVAGETQRTHSEVDMSVPCPACGAATAWERYPMTRELLWLENSTLEAWGCGACNWVLAN